MRSVMAQGMWVGRAGCCAVYVVGIAVDGVLVQSLDAPSLLDGVWSREMIAVVVCRGALDGGRW